MGVGVSSSDVGATPAARGGGARMRAGNNTLMMSFDGGIEDGDGLWGDAPQSTDRKQREYMKQHGAGRGVCGSVEDDTDQEDDDRGGAAEDWESSSDNRHDVETRETLERGMRRRRRKIGMRHNVFNDDYDKARVEHRGVGDYSLLSAAGCGNLGGRAAGRGVAAGFLSISVPETVEAAGSMYGSHTEYVVKYLQGTEVSRVTRRYREFDDLHLQLTSALPAADRPCLPPKQFFGNRDPFFVEKRRVLVDQYLKQLVAQEYALSVPVFWNFLSADEMTMAIGSFLCTRSAVPEELRLARLFHFVDRLTNKRDSLEFETALTNLANAADGEVVKKLLAICDCRPFTGPQPCHPSLAPPIISRIRACLLLRQLAHRADEANHGFHYESTAVCVSILTFLAIHHPSARGTSGQRPRQSRPGTANATSRPSTASKFVTAANLRSTTFPAVTADPFEEHEEHPSDSNCESDATRRSSEIAPMPLPPAVLAKDVIMRHHHPFQHHHQSFLSSTSSSIPPPHHHHRTPLVASHPPSATHRRPPCAKSLTLLKDLCREIILRCAYRCPRSMFSFLSIERNFSSIVFLLNPVTSENHNPHEDGLPHDQRRDFESAAAAEGVHVWLALVLWSAIRLKDLQKLLTPAEGLGMIALSKLYHSADCNARLVCGLILSTLLSNGLLANASTESKAAASLAALPRAIQILSCRGARLAAVDRRRPLHHSSCTDDEEPRTNDHRQQQQQQRRRRRQSSHRGRSAVPLDAVSETFGVRNVSANREAVRRQEQASSPVTPSRSPEEAAAACGMARAVFPLSPIRGLIGHQGPPNSIERRLRRFMDGEADSTDNQQKAANAAAVEDENRFPNDENSNENLWGLKRKFVPGGIGASTHSPTNHRYSTPTRSRLASVGAPPFSERREGRRRRAKGGELTTSRDVLPAAVGVGIVRPHTMCRVTARERRPSSGLSSDEWPSAGKEITARVSGMDMKRTTGRQNLSMMTNMRGAMTRIETVPLSSVVENAYRAIELRSDQLAESVIHSAPRGAVGSSVGASVGARDTGGEDTAGQNEGRGGMCGESVEVELDFVVLYSVWRFGGEEVLPQILLQQQQRRRLRKLNSHHHDNDDNDDGVGGYDGPCAAGSAVDGGRFGDCEGAPSILDNGVDRGSSECGDGRQQECFPELVNFVLWYLLTLVARARHVHGCNSGVMPLATAVVEVRQSGWATERERASLLAERRGHLFLDPNLNLPPRVQSSSSSPLSSSLSPKISALPPECHYAAHDLCFPPPHDAHLLTHSSLDVTQANSYILADLVAEATFFCNNNNISNIDCSDGDTNNQPSANHNPSASASASSPAARLTSLINDDASSASLRSPPAKGTTSSATKKGSPTAQGGTLGSSSASSARSKSFVLDDPALSLIRRGVASLALTFLSETRGSGSRGSEAGRLSPVRNGHHDERYPVDGRLQQHLRSSMTFYSGDASLAAVTRQYAAALLISLTSRNAQQTTTASNGGNSSRGKLSTQQRKPVRVTMRSGSKLADAAIGTVAARNTLCSIDDDGKREGKASVSGVIQEHTGDVDDDDDVLPIFEIELDSFARRLDAAQELLAHFEAQSIRGRKLLEEEKNLLREKFRIAKTRKVAASDEAAECLSKLREMNSAVQELSKVEETLEAALSRAQSCVELRTEWRERAADRQGRLAAKFSGFEAELRELREVSERRSAELVRQVKLRKENLRVAEESKHDAWRELGELKSEVSALRKKEQRDHFELMQTTAQWQEKVQQIAELPKHASDQLAELERSRAAIADCKALRDACDAESASHQAALSQLEVQRAEFKRQIATVETSRRDFLADAAETSGMDTGSAGDTGGMANGTGVAICKYAKRLPEGCRSAADCTGTGVSEDTTIEKIVELCTRDRERAVEAFLDFLDSKKRNLESRLESLSGETHRLTIRRLADTREQHANQLEQLERQFTKLTHQVENAKTEKELEDEQSELQAKLRELEQAYGPLTEHLEERTAVHAQLEIQCREKEEQFAFCREQYFASRDDLHRAIEEGNASRAKLANKIICQESAARQLLGDIVAFREDGLHASTNRYVLDSLLVAERDARFRTRQRISETIRILQKTDARLAAIDDNPVNIISDRVYPLKERCSDDGGDATSSSSFHGGRQFVGQYDDVTGVVGTMVPRQGEKNELSPRGGCGWETRRSHSPSRLSADGFNDREQHDDEDHGDDNIDADDGDVLRESMDTCRRQDVDKVDNVDEEKRHQDLDHHWSGRTFARQPPGSAPRGMSEGPVPKYRLNHHHRRHDGSRRHASRDSRSLLVREEEVVVGGNDDSPLSSRQQPPTSWGRPSIRMPPSRRSFPEELRDHGSSPGSSLEECTPTARADTSAHPFWKLSSRSNSSPNAQTPKADGGF